MSDSGVDSGSDTESLGAMSVGSSAPSDDEEGHHQVVVGEAGLPVDQPQVVVIEEDEEDPPDGEGPDILPAEPGQRSPSPVPSTSRSFELSWNSSSFPPLSFSSQSFSLYQDWKAQPDQHVFSPKMKKDRHKSHSHYPHQPNQNGSFHDFLIDKKLRQAANVCDAPTVRRLLDDGANPCSVDDRMRSALHFVSCKGPSTPGSIEVAKLLLERGSDPNQQDIIGNTPLHLAACTNNLEMVTLLLKYGTDLTVLDKSGRNPLHLAESKLNVLMMSEAHSSDGRSDNLSTIKNQILQVIEMMSVYLQRSGHSQSSGHVEMLTTFTSRLQLHHTKKEVDIDVHDLLASLSHLSINQKKTD